jgi:hypothetical protein
LDLIDNSPSNIREEIINETADAKYKIEIRELKSGDQTS